MGVVIVAVCLLVIFFRTPSSVVGPLKTLVTVEDPVVLEKLTQDKINEQTQQHAQFLQQLQEQKEQEKQFDGQDLTNEGPGTIAKRTSKQQDIW